MANPFYTASNNPGTGAPGASSPMRAEFQAIQDAFDKLPALSPAGAAVVVNSGGTGLTVTTGTLALAGNLATTGAFNTTLVQRATVTLTLPAVNGTLATLTGTETLSNKTIDSSCSGGAGLSVSFAATAGSAATAATASAVAASGITGGALASNVTASSLTSFGTSIVLGTPGSGTLTNCGGLPAAGIVAGALASGMTATTQAALDNSGKLATTAYADNNLIQIVTAPVNSATSAAAFAGTYGLAGSVPTTGGGVHVTPFDKAFTPKNAASTLEIEVILKGVLNSAATAFTVALFNTNTLIDYTVVFVGGGGTNFIQTVILKTYFAPGSVSPLALRVFVGTTDGSAFNLNSFQGAGAQPSMISWLAVKEILPHA